MTAENYIAVAKIIAETDLPNEAREKFGIEMARLFKADNPNFVPERFFEAAAISGEDYA